MLEMHRSHDDRVVVYARVAYFTCRGASENVCMRKASAKRLDQFSSLQSLAGAEHERQLRGRSISVGELRPPPVRTGPQLLLDLHTSTLLLAARVCGGWQDR